VDNNLTNRGKMTAKLDLIEGAVKAANAPVFKRRIGKASKEHFAYLREVQQLDTTQANIWRDAVKQTRRVFRKEFHPESWKNLYIEFAGKGYSTRYDTYATGAYVTYAASWHGMTFSRSFCPTCMEDVKAEAWRLAGALLGWHGGTTE
jgi:hypothetical protein